ncbi:GcrA family cell cycle regulator [Brevundimonas sp.]|jgi:GcrA cell cycle regulator|uniref:GcrA family cell cycle regulator n=1 Tax=Brevundimonas sp. TaxID=1871086 RepID=UPI0035687AE0
MIASAWTEDRIDRLRTLWLEGRTADVISQDLGCGISRSAVLGKVYRLGLSAGRTSRTPKVSAPKARTPVRVAQPAPNRAATPLASPEPPPEPQCGTRTILSVGRTDCRWPLGDPLQPGFSLCGGPVARGAFCVEHAEIAYRPRPHMPQKPGAPGPTGLTSSLDRPFHISSSARMATSKRSPLS